jgi:hypothetical protein
MELTQAYGISAAVFFLWIDSMQGKRLDSIPQTSCGLHTTPRVDLKLIFRSKSSNKVH